MHDSLSLGGAEAGGRLPICRTTETMQCLPLDQTTAQRHTGL